MRGLSDFLSRTVFHSFVCVDVEGHSEIPARCTSSPLPPKWRQFVERKEREFAEAGKVGGLTAQKDSKKYPLTKPTLEILSEGKLEYRLDYNDVWFGGVHYSLRRRPKARFCIQFLVEERAFDETTARHLKDEIDPYVRNHAGGLPKAADIKIDHYFHEPKDRKNRIGLAKLRAGLIRSAGKGCYFLNAE